MWLGLYHVAGWWFQIRRGVGRDWSGLFFGFCSWEKSNRSESFELWTGSYGHSRTERGKNMATSEKIEGRHRTELDSVLEWPEGVQQHIWRQARQVDPHCRTENSRPKTPFSERTSTRDMRIRWRLRDRKTRRSLRHETRRHDLAWPRSHLHQI